MFTYHPAPILFYDVDYERMKGVPVGTVKDLIVAAGNTGSFRQLERGHITAEGFGPAFTREGKEYVSIKYVCVAL